MTENHTAKSDLRPWETNPFAPMFFEPGHYYSPIADIREVRSRHDAIFAVPRSVAGIDLRVSEQLDLAVELGELIEGHPFGDEPAGALRYGFSNPFFGYGDALVLYGMLRKLRPARYVEIGSGWSSALALDLIDLELRGTTSCTFIEPYPDRLHSLLRDEDGQRSDVDIIAEPIANLDTSIFAELSAGDVLFIDSTHVSRVGSDVNSLYFEVLPSLPAGVHVHVHDIFFPFEYIPEWVYEGRGWNEAYLLRAYLINNPKIRVTWFNDYLAKMHRPQITEHIPLWDRNTGGSIWLETLA